MVPLGLLAFKTSDLTDQRLDGFNVTVLVLVGLTVACGSVRAWHLAGLPRLSVGEQRDLRGDLGKERYRQMARALRHGEPLPHELRSWAAAYAWSRRGESPYISVFVAFVAANTLPSSPASSTPGPLTWFLVSTLVLMLAGILAMVATSSRLWRNARRLDLPVDRMTPTTERR